MQRKSFLKLKDFFSGFNPVLDISIKKNQYFPIDLSLENEKLHTLNLASADDMECYINNLLKENNSTVAYGGYLEKRNLYKRSSYFNDKKERNIHLGIDYWCDENTAVISPLDGEIHSFKNNKNFGDYGPTLILSHNVEDFSFYTLYGHLTEESISNIKKGQSVSKNEVIGFLGSNNINGNYAPHLHFQIILDLQNKKGDYPGVCSKEDVLFYSNNSPDPNIIVGL